MIISFTGMGLFVLTFVLLKLKKIYYQKYVDSGNNKFNSISDAYDTLATSCFIIATCIEIIAVLLMTTAVTTEELRVKEAQDTHDAYIKLLEESKDITVQNQLYTDIVKYNSKLRKNKYFRESPWTNWFFAEGWEKLEYIEIK